MCEIFGFSACSPRQITSELKEFFTHSRKHPDGWGLVVFDEENRLFYDLERIWRDGKVIDISGEWKKN